MDIESQRKQLIEQLRFDGIKSEKVLEAIAKVPRELFVSEDCQPYSYENVALPIGYEQTISQPYVVARMTQAVMREQHLKRVLEIGTGSGYQAAILSQIYDEVYTLDRLKPLIDQADGRFRQLKLANIHSFHADGYLGWSDNAPYDAILVTAKVPAVPAALKEQLADGARMIVPVEDEAGRQALQLIVRRQAHYDVSVLDPVSFVPLVPGKKD